MYGRSVKRPGRRMSDPIDRQMAIDVVNEWFRLYAINRTMSNVTSIQDILRQMPSVEIEVTAKMVESYCYSRGLRVITEELYLHLTRGKFSEPIVIYKDQRKKGEWHDIGGVIRYGCPFCHHAQERKSNYCPNCGADMRGEENE